jgi:hypothetical protein
VGLPPAITGLKFKLVLMITFGFVPGVKFDGAGVDSFLHGGAPSPSRLIVLLPKIKFFN